MEINAHLKNLTDRIVRLEVQTEQMRQRNDAQEMVLGWLLTRFPHDKAARFLAIQANRMEDHPKFEEDVALLDYLRELVAYWHDQTANGQ